MTLSILWFVLIAVLWTVYLILEGFDFGVGMLLPFVAKGDRERTQAVRTIGPHWDGNEVWLLTAGGAIRFVDIFHFNFRGVCQAKGQLIPTQLHLDRVAHRCDLAQGDFGAGGQPHIQQVMTQFALPANRAQHSILPNF